MSFGNSVDFNWIYNFVFDIPGIYYYQCDPHASMGMTGVINVTDCNGVLGGTSMIDTCGTCHQAYIYDFISHSVTFIDDTSNVNITPTEMVVIPNHPQNPYWVIVVILQIHLV